MRNKIYLAENETPVRKVIVETINLLFPEYQEGIKQFDNGKSLYERLMTHNNEVKLVLTDDNMPKMNGSEVIKKCHKLYPEIPFIQMSALGTKKESLEAGAKDFILKPFNITTLLSTLEKYL